MGCLSACQKGDRARLPFHGASAMPSRCGKVCAVESAMTWLTWLLVALVVATLAALTGVKPKGTRPVARTHLMGVARVVLIVAVLIVAYVAFRAHAGG